MENSERMPLCLPKIVRMRVFFSSRKLNSKSTGWLPVQHVLFPCKAKQVCQWVISIKQLCERKCTILSTYWQDDSTDSGRDL
jgi:hypothetical protein